MKNILLRSLTGLIYVGLIITCVLVSDVTYLCLVSLLCILASVEFFKLANHDSAKSISLINVIDILCGLSLIGGIWAFVNYFSPYILGVFPLPVIARFISTLYIKDGLPLRNLARSMTGIMYIALPLALSTMLYEISKHIVLAMFVFIWINDTGAFLVGSAIGRHRLFERISPKKSWEGFWGGLVFCIAAAIAMFNFWPCYFTDLKMGTMILFGIVVSVFATWGDLVESLIKRTINVKDSGNIMPGHGGILDRIDSLLIVIPAVMCMMIFLM